MGGRRERRGPGDRSRRGGVSGPGRYAPARRWRWRASGPCCGATLSSRLPHRHRLAQAIMTTPRSEGRWEVWTRHCAERCRPGRPWYERRWQACHEHGEPDMGGDQQREGPPSRPGVGLAALHTPGRLVNRASDGYRAEGKTDARVIADPVEDRIGVARLCGAPLSVFPGSGGGRGRRTPAHRPIPGEKTIAELVHTPTGEGSSLDEQFSELDRLIKATPAPARPGSSTSPSTGPPTSTRSPPPTRRSTGSSCARWRRAGAPRSPRWRSRPPRPDPYLLPG